MAHPAQEEFIKNCLMRFNNIILRSKNVLEVGSQIINGSIRDYFPDAKSKTWVGLDIGEGDGVDFTIPGELVQLPNGWADIAFSAECFEHDKNWPKIFLNLIRVTGNDSLIILTFAGKGRPAHGTIDSDVGSSPFTNFYYKNIDLVDFVSEFEIDKYFSKYSIEVNLKEGDTYFWGLRNNTYEDTELLSIEESLARVRGQLGMVIEENNELKKDLSNQVNFKLTSLILKIIYNNIFTKKIISLLRKLKNYM